MKIKVTSIKSFVTTSSIVLSTLLFTACSIEPPNNSISTNSISDTLNNSALHNQSLNPNSQNIPDAISSALLPKIRLHVNTHDQHLQRYDMVVNNAPATTFFQSLAKDTHENLIVSPKVSGFISLNAHHMSLPEILKAVHKIYGYRFEKTSYGYNVYSKMMMTKIFHVSYLDMSRTGQSQTSISAGSISKNSQSSSTGTSTNESSAQSTQPASTVTTTIEHHFWKELKFGVAMIIGEESEATQPVPVITTNGEGIATQAEPLPAAQASVLVNPQAGLVIVKAYPDQLDRVAKYLREVQNIMHREVMINAKIVEVQLGAGFQSGVDWQILGAHQNTTDSINPDLPTMSNIFTLAAGGGNLNTTIKLLSSQGRVNILSSPRITTVNNQKALIKIGNDDYYITGVTSNTTSSTSTTTSENVDLTPFFSGIALDVTPEIAKNGDITMHIHPIISTVSSKELQFNTSQDNGKTQKLPLASSSIRESDNIVRVKNNQIILIGGMMEDKNSSHQGGTPFLSKVPGLGNLFKRQDYSGGKTEIVILLQPKLMNNNTTNQILRDTAKRYSDLTNDFTFSTNFQPAKAPKH